MMFIDYMSIQNMYICMAWCVRIVVFKVFVSCAFADVVTGAGIHFSSVAHEIDASNIGSMSTIKYIVLLVKVARLFRLTDGQETQSFWIAAKFYKVVQIIMAVMVVLVYEKKSTMLPSLIWFRTNCWLKKVRSQSILTTSCFVGRSHLGTSFLKMWKYLYLLCTRIDTVQWTRRSFTSETYYPIPPCWAM